MALGASDGVGLLALVEAARGGDRKAFDELDRGCRGGITRVLRSRGVRRAEDVGDLTQEGLIVAWQRLPQLREAAVVAIGVRVTARRVAAAHGQRPGQDEPEEFADKESDAAGPDV